MSCTHTTGAASAVPLAFMPFDMLQTTCILTTCGCSGMLAMYRRRDDQRESLDWQSRGQAFGARALNPIECGPLPANVSFLSVLDDKTSQMLFVLWRQVALVKGHFSERIASCVKKRLSSPLLKCIPQTGYGCVRALPATSIRSTRIGLEFLMYHAGIQGLLRPVFGVLLHVDSFLHYSFVASHGSEGTRRLSTCIDLWGRFLSCCERSCFAEPVEYSGCHIELRDTCDLRLVNTAVAA